MDRAVKWCFTDSGYMDFGDDERWQYQRQRWRCLCQALPPTLGKHFRGFADDEGRS